MLLAATLHAPVVTAQSGAGSIQGTVQDTTHAVIPGATITVVNQATGVSTTTKSNRVGFYQVPGLFTGTYTVTASAPNMKAYKTSIHLLAAQDAVINPVMTAGAVTQNVVVSGNTYQLTDTSNGAISSTLDNTRINQLPENGRLLTTLIQMTTPGLENGSYLNSGENFNGLDPEAAEYVEDGVATTNLLKGSSMYVNGNFKGSLEDPDAVQEVRVEATDGGAQYATPATVILTTKSGTNSLHGTFFETARNNAIGIAKARQNPSNYNAPQLVRNEFGLSAGGPIILPHVYHGKDKSFWFFAYERYSLVQGVSILARVPPLAMRQGDFSGLINSAGLLQTLFDPATTTYSANCSYTGAVNPYCRTPFQNNQIPIGRLSPTAKILYDLYPQPTSNANPLVTSNTSVTNNVYQVIPQITFRLDHVFNENNRAYLRYTNNNDGTNLSPQGQWMNPAADGIPAGAANGYNDSPQNTFAAAIGYTHVFSPTFFSETILSQQWQSMWGLRGAAQHFNYEKMLGLPNNFGELGFPQISGGISSFSGGQKDYGLSQILSNIDENLTKVAGRNQLHFGGRFRHERVGSWPGQTTDTIGFNNMSTALYNTKSGANYTTLPNTGYGEADFFLGSASNYTVQLMPPYAHYHVMEFDAYFQDDYHVARNLTVNLGLRYEAHPAYWTKYGATDNFDLKHDAMVLAAPISTLISEGYTTQAIITNDENIGVKFETPQEAGMPSQLMDSYYLNLLPRAGIAYQPFGGRYGTVIRGGYGRYLYPLPFEDFASHPQENNPFVATYSQNYTAANQAIDQLPNELIRYNAPQQFGVMGINTANVVDSNTTNAILPGINQFGTDPDFAPDFATETNFTIEQPMKGNSVLRASWVWTHATNLDLAFRPNNHPSTYQWEMAYGVIPPNGGASVIGTPQQNTYAATATGPYDQTTWGGVMNIHQKVGWSNYNALQLNYQRLFHNGVGYQIAYVFGKSLVAGGDWAEATYNHIYPDANYPGVLGTVATMSSPYGSYVYPGVPAPARPSGLPVWANYHAMNKYQLYSVDASVPFDHIFFNGVVDLPFGRGKRFLGNVNRFVNELVGGFQLAGDGTIVSQVFGTGEGYSGQTSPVKIYKHKVPITDCRSGNCYKAYLWWNGYLPPTVTTGVNGSACTKNCVSGVPASYQPVQAPIDNTPGTKYYGDDEVQITAPNLNSGQPTPIGYDVGPNGGYYLNNSVANGPMNWNADLSVFKVFPITERVNLRFNVDAFNVFNVQGYTNPGGNGIEEVQPGVGQASSYWSPRQIQITGRFTF
jgi:hypothetical protein